MEKLFLFVFVCFLDVVFVTPWNILLCLAAFEWKALLSHSTAKLSLDFNVLFVFCQLSRRVKSFVRPDSLAIRYSRRKFNEKSFVSKAKFWNCCVEWRFCVLKLEFPPRRKIMLNNSFPFRFIELMKASATHFILFSIIISFCFLPWRQQQEKRFFNFVRSKMKLRNGEEWKHFFVASKNTICQQAQCQAILKVLFAIAKRNVRVYFFSISILHFAILCFSFPLNAFSFECPSVGSQKAFLRTLAAACASLKLDIIYDFKLVCR